jgi:hypothetical protein
MPVQRICATQGARAVLSMQWSSGPVEGPHQPHQEATLEAVNSVTPPFGESGAVRTDRLFSMVQAAAAAGEFPVHPAVPQGRVLVR